MRSFFDWLVQLWRRFTRPWLRLQWIDEEPGSLSGGTLYVVGTPEFQKWAIFACPCGCRDRIELYLGHERRPHWTIKVEHGRATIIPSVWQTGGCGAHFFVRRGRVDFV